MIQLTETTIDVASALAQVQSPHAGAALLFLGMTRQWTGSAETTQLHYEGHAPLLEQILTELHDEAVRRWSLTGCVLVHRLGTVPIGEASVAVVVSSPHRDAAFAAGRWLIDTLKERAPIWKKECQPRGDHWVHPGIGETP